MTKHNELIEAEVLELSAIQRAALAQKLLASLDEIDDQENDRLWLDGLSGELRFIGQIR